MKIAIISDIHGNLPAFKAVVEDIKKEKVDYVIGLGDIVFGGLYPQECYDLLKSLTPICLIKGNTDQNLEELSSFIPKNQAENRLYEMIKFTKYKLTDEAIKDIESWPIYKKFDIDRFRILACHGSKENNREIISSHDRNFYNQKDKIEKEEVNFFFCGHTHIAEIVEIKDTLLINPGGIGYSFDDDYRPSYALITKKDHKIISEIRKVNYDALSYSREIEKEEIFDKELSKIIVTGHLERKTN